mmetsp:Transcript_101446/g.262237  ORF Transcript_101446/g.262237 Transcript_101446/m.262237 type:complete len:464 (+) Transcript_101446:1439-2830(+)
MSAPPSSCSLLSRMCTWLSIFSYSPCRSSCFSSSSWYLSFHFEPLSSPAGEAGSSARIFFFDGLTGDDSSSVGAASLVSPLLLASRFFNRAISASLSLSAFSWFAVTFAIALSMSWSVERVLPLYKALSFASSCAFSRALLASRSSFSTCRDFSSCRFSSATSPLSVSFGRTAALAWCSDAIFDAFFISASFSVRLCRSCSISRCSASTCACDASSSLRIARSRPSACCDTLRLSATCCSDGATSCGWTTTCGGTSPCWAALASWSWICTDETCSLSASISSRSVAEASCSCVIASLCRASASCRRRTWSASRASWLRSFLLSAMRLLCSPMACSSWPPPGVSSSSTGCDGGSTYSVRMPSFTRSSTTSRTNFLVVSSRTNSSGSKNITGSSSSERRTRCASGLMVRCVSRSALSSRRYARRISLNFLLNCTFVCSSIFTCPNGSLGTGKCSMSSRSIMPCST